MDSLHMLRSLRTFSDNLFSVVSVEGSDIQSVVMRQALEVSSASYANLLLFDDKQNTLEYHYSIRAESQTSSPLLHACVFAEGSIEYRVLQTLEPHVLSAKDSAQLYSVQHLQTTPVAAMLIPLHTGQQAYALLELVLDSASGLECFDPMHVEAAIIVANFTSFGMSSASLFHRAIHDMLTGLYNAHYFREEMTSLIQRSQRFTAIFSLVIFDIDDFKSVNDKYGHRVGDTCLAHVARHLVQTVRSGVDVCARYGGDEFVILLPNTDAKQAEHVCNRLRRHIQRSPVQGGEQKISVTLSMGVAIFPRHGDAQEALFERADQALYAAKSLGRNRVMVWSEDLRQ